jgi:hypothetical protein
VPGPRRAALRVPLLVELRANGAQPTAGGRRAQAGAGADGSSRTTVAPEPVAAT